MKDQGFGTAPGESPSPSSKSLPDTCTRYTVQLASPGGTGVRTRRSGAGHHVATEVAGWMDCETVVLFIASENRIWIAALTATRIAPDDGETAATWGAARGRSTGPPAAAGLPTAMRPATTTRIARLRQSRAGGPFPMVAGHRSHLGSWGGCFGRRWRGRLPPAHQEDSDDEQDNRHDRDDDPHRIDGERLGGNAAGRRGAQDALPV